MDKEGHTFLGWATTSTSKRIAYRPGANYKKNSSLKLYAVWEADTYKISYNSNGGGSVPAVQTKIYGKALKLSTFVPKRTGYTFQGWSKRKGSTIVRYRPGDKFEDNEDTTLYAVWRINTYKIIYNANKGQNEPKSQTKKYGTTIVLSNKKPTRDGYIFVGWSTEKNSTIVYYKPGGNYSANKSVVLYAVWIQKEYKINYYANGGSGGVKLQIKKYNEDLKLSKNIPYRVGYTFLGWGLSNDSTTISYYPGDIYKTNKAKDLYAIWGKTKKKIFEDTHAMISIGTGVGAIKATCIYTEDYIRKPTQISFYNHRTYLSLDLSKLNDEEDFIVYPPKVVTHKEKSGTKLKSFVVNKKEDILETSDYIFSYFNQEKVTYSREKDIIGSCGFVVKYGPDTWSAPAVKMSLNNSILKLSGTGIQEKNTEYYYLLGSIENENIQNEMQNQKSLRYFSNGKKVGANLEKEKRLVARGKDYMVYDTDIESYIKEKSLSHKITYQDVIDIINHILVEKELNKLAENAGCTKSNEEVKVYINELRKELKSADNYNEFLAFISGTGMSEDEYWEVKIGDYGEQLMRKEYIEKLYQEYSAGEILSISGNYNGIFARIEERMEKDENSKADFVKKLKEIILEEMKVEIVEDIDEYIYSN